MGGKNEKLISPRSLWNTFIGGLSLDLASMDASLCILPYSGEAGAIRECMRLHTEEISSFPPAPSSSL